MYVKGLIEIKRSLNNIHKAELDTLILDCSLVALLSGSLTDKNISFAHTVRLELFSVAIGDLLADFCKLDMESAVSQRALYRNKQVQIMKSKVKVRYSEIRMHKCLDRHIRLT